MKPLSSHFPKFIVTEHGQRVGIAFQCPLHGDHRIAVLCNPPFDSGPPAEGRAWARMGDDFDKLTLTPSIDAPCGWHGFVTEGQVDPSENLPAQGAGEVTP